tara:strand:- start:999 stop:1226 length:228 start_codon:yes stop_codon:yes gene_type:complete
MALSVTDKLHKTRLSINNYVGRGNALSTQRGCDLVNRYNDLIDAAKGEIPGEITWRDYCAGFGAATDHDADFKIA